jgi:hypothetical protein
MSTLPPPPPGASPAPPPQPYPPSAPVAKKSRGWLWGVIGLVVGLIIGGAIGAGASGSDDDTASVEVVAGDEPAATTTTKAPTTTTTKPAPYTPKPEDFTIGIIETERSCFGSAGCNIQYRIEVSYTGLPVKDGSEWLVTYDVLGGETTKTASFTITDEGKYEYRPDFISTPPNPSLTATATRVIEE